MLMEIKKGDTGLASRVKDLRETKLKISQEKLAELAGIALPTLQKIEQGAQFGRSDTHKKLAHALGVTVSYLVYGTPSSATRSLPLPESLTESEIYFLQELTDFFDYKHNQRRMQDLEKDAAIERKYDEAMQEEAESGPEFTPAFAKLIEERRHITRAKAAEANKRKLGGG